MSPSPSSISQPICPCLSRYAWTANQHVGRCTLKGCSTSQQLYVGKLLHLPTKYLNENNLYPHPHKFPVSNPASGNPKRYLDDVFFQKRSQGCNLDPSKLKACTMLEDSNKTPRQITVKQGQKNPGSFKKKGYPSKKLLGTSVNVHQH